MRPCAEGKALLRAADRRYHLLGNHHKEVFQEEKQVGGGQNHRNRGPGSEILILDERRSGAQNDQSPLSRASIGTDALQGSDLVATRADLVQWKNCT